MNKKKNLKHDYDAIYQRHLAGETIANISKETGIHIQSIYSHFQKNNWNYNKNIPIRQNGYYVDDNYLNIIDNENKAYFLGWMLSDGSINGNRIKLKLKSDDEYIISKMFNEFSKGYKCGSDKNSMSIGVSSTKMVSDLAKYGCVENKTIIGFGLPELPKELFRHFVRGYFDGDGSVGKRSARPNQIQVSVCSIDESFLIQFQKKLKEFNIKSNVYKEKRNTNMFRLVISTHDERLKFYEFIYNNCSIKLERKFEKYSEYYNKTIYLKNINETNKKIVLEMLKQGKCEFAIHKETKIGRCVIRNIAVEYNYTK